MSSGAGHGLGTGWRIFTMADDSSRISARATVLDMGFKNGDTTSGVGPNKVLPVSYRKFILCFGLSGS